MDDQKHPRGLFVLFFTEMWERFSFYLLLGILLLYLTDSEKGGLGWDDKTAAMLVGSYIALVYFTPFIGGLIADRFLGCRKTIILGGVLMMLGHLALAWPTELGLYVGLSLLILGNGAFKPNISTLVGNLYPAGSPLKDVGYNIFYMGINIGAFVCNFVAAIVRNYFDANPLQITDTWKLEGWHAAFSTAAFGMLLGLINFLFYYKQLAHADQQHARSSGDQESIAPFFYKCLIPAIVLGALGWILADESSILWFSTSIFGETEALYESPFNGPTAAFLAACIPTILFYLSIWRGVEDRGERGRVAALLVVFGVVIVFWMTFHLNTTALTTWSRDNTTREPSAGVRLITDTMPQFAENAPASYYSNASPELPRPAKDTFTIVSKEKYEQLKEEKKLKVQENEPLYVTQEMFDKVYEKTDSNTPLLETGKHVKLVNTELYQSINPGFVILFTPLLVGFWRMLYRKGKEPTTFAKIGFGLLLTAGAPLTMLGATLLSNDGELKASSGWLFGTYAMVTLGELCLSPMGLSLVNKLSPKKISAFMMGGWFVATSFGNKLSGIFGEVYTEMDHVQFWTVLIVCDVVFAGIIFLLLPWLKRQAEGHQG